MSDKGFLVKIITPETTAFEGEVESLVAPGEVGYLGVLRGHAPLVTPLVKGHIDLRLANRGGEKRYEISRGFMEVSNNQALLLVESIQETSPAV